MLDGLLCYTSTLRNMKTVIYTFNNKLKYFNRTHLKILKFWACIIKAALWIPRYLHYSNDNLLYIVLSSGSMCKNSGVCCPLDQFSQFLRSSWSMLIVDSPENLNENFQHFHNEAVNGCYKSSIPQSLSLHTTWPVFRAGRINLLFDLPGFLSSV